MSKEVNRYRNQWDNDKEDNFGSIMPITIYRVVWKDKSSGKYNEFWTEDELKAYEKKDEIDHSDGALIYVNFESWFAYRSDEHDKRFGGRNRERGWWEPRR